jgi:flagellum-specific peptidoglycan hydrolase FlgJ
MTSSSRAEFIRRALEAADKAKGEGAPIVSAIAAAQAALESNYGASRLATEANNLFGVKAGKSWLGPTLDMSTSEVEDGKVVTIIAVWRKYASWEECFRDYGNIIQLKPWFADAASAGRRNDAEEFLRELASHWATDSSYEVKVWAVATRWGLV